MARLTELRRPLTRRIGSLVVRISADGIELRGRRRRRWRRISWARIACLAVDDVGGLLASLEEKQGAEALAAMGAAGGKAAEAKNDPA